MPPPHPPPRPAWWPPLCARRLSGCLVISEARPEAAVYYKNQAANENRNRRLAVDNDYLLMEDFAQAIDTDGETILDARAGRAICKTVRAAVDSGRLGKPVEVN